MKKQKGLTKSYIESLPKRLIVYIYPIFLFIIELTLKFIFNVDTLKFIVPTLTATSIGITLPLITFTSTKKWSVDKETIEQMKQLENKGLIVEDRTSSAFRSVCSLITLILTIIWVISIIFSSIDITNYHPSSLESSILPFYISNIFTSNYFLGLFCYFVGLVVSEIKEFI